MRSPENTQPESFDPGCAGRAIDYQPTSRPWRWRRARPRCRRCSRRRRRSSRCSRRSRGRSGWRGCCSCCRRGGCSGSSRRSGRCTWACRRRGRRATALQDVALPAGCCTTGAVAEVLIKRAVGLLHAGCGAGVAAGHRAVDHIKAALPLIQPHFEVGRRGWAGEIDCAIFDIEDAVGRSATSTEVKIPQFPPGKTEQPEFASVRRSSQYGKTM